MGKQVREVPEIDMHKLRDELGFTWEEFGGALGVGRQQAHMMANGERSVTPTMAICLHYLAKEAGVVDKVLVEAVAEDA